ncbi:MAG: hypothetical protein JW841_12500 [Deltaproteobacteria bacterium]|nr:hypothetical protein [Deltaproteobacteria bacterium]
MTYAPTSNSDKSGTSTIAKINQQLSANKESRSPSAPEIAAQIVNGKGDLRAAAAKLSVWLSSNHSNENAMTQFVMSLLGQAGKSSQKIQRLNAFMEHLRANNPAGRYNEIINRIRELRQAVVDNNPYVATTLGLVKPSFDAAFVFKATDQHRQIAKAIACDLKGYTSKKEEAHVVSLLSNPRITAADRLSILKLLAADGYDLARLCDEIEDPKECAKIITLLAEALREPPGADAKAPLSKFGLTQIAAAVKDLSSGFTSAKEEAIMAQLLHLIAPTQLSDFMRVAADVDLDFQDILSELEDPQEREDFLNKAATALDTKTRAAAIESLAAGWTRKWEEQAMAKLLFSLDDTDLFNKQEIREQLLRELEAKGIDYNRIVAELEKSEVRQQFKDSYEALENYARLRDGEQFIPGRGIPVTRSDFAKVSGKEEIKVATSATKKLIASSSSYIDTQQWRKITTGLKAADKPAEAISFLNQGIKELDEIVADARAAQDGAKAASERLISSRGELERILQQAKAVMANVPLGCTKWRVANHAHAQATTQIQRINAKLDVLQKQLGPSGAAQATNVADIAVVNDLGQSLKRMRDLVQRYEKVKDQAAQAALLVDIGAEHTCAAKLLERVDATMQDGLLTRPVLKRLEAFELSLGILNVVENTAQQLTTDIYTVALKECLPTDAKTAGLRRHAYSLIMNIDAQVPQNTGEQNKKLAQRIDAEVGVLNKRIASLSAEYDKANDVLEADKERQRKQPPQAATAEQIIKVIKAQAKLDGAGMGSLAQQIAGLTELRKKLRQQSDLIHTHDAVLAKHIHNRFMALGLSSPIDENADATQIEALFIELCKMHGVDPGTYPSDATWGEIDNYFNNKIQEIFQVQSKLGGVINTILQNTCGYTPAQLKSAGVSDITPEAMMRGINALRKELAMFSPPLPDPLDPASIGDLIKLANGETIAEATQDHPQSLLIQAWQARQVDADTFTNDDISRLIANFANINTDNSSAKSLGELQRAATDLHNSPALRNSLNKLAKHPALFRAIAAQADGLYTNGASLADINAFVPRLAGYTEHKIVISAFFENAAQLARELNACLPESILKDDDEDKVAEVFENLQPHQIAMVIAEYDRQFGGKDAFFNRCVSNLSGRDLGYIYYLIQRRPISERIETNVALIGQGDPERAARILGKRAMDTSEESGGWGLEASIKFRERAYNATSISNYYANRARKHLSLAREAYVNYQAARQNLDKISKRDIGAYAVAENEVIKARDIFFREFALTQDGLAEYVAIEDQAVDTAIERLEIANRVVRGVVVISVGTIVTIASLGAAAPAVGTAGGVVLAVGTGATAAGVTSVGMQALDDTMRGKKIDAMRLMEAYTDGYREEAVVGVSAILPSLAFGRLAAIAQNAGRAGSVAMKLTTNPLGRAAFGGIVNVTNDAMGRFISTVGKDPGSISEAERWSVTGAGIAFFTGGILGAAAPKIPQAGLRAVAFDASTGAADVLLRSLLEGRKPTIEQMVQTVITGVITGAAARHAHSAISSIRGAKVTSKSEAGVAKTSSKTANASATRALPAPKWMQKAYQRVRSMAGLLPKLPYIRHTAAPQPPKTASVAAEVVSPANKASKQFLATNKLHGPVPDGYVDGGRSTNIGSDGSIIFTSKNPREVIVVDRQRDVRLNEFIEHAKSPEVMALSPEQRVRHLAMYVDHIMNGGGERATVQQRMNSWIQNGVDGTNGYGGQEVLLGDVGVLGGGMCRHRALLFHMLATEAGLNSTLVRGNLQIPNGEGGHAWSEVIVNGKRFIVDVMNPMTEGFTQIPSTKDPIAAAYRKLNQDGSSSAAYDSNGEPTLEVTTTGGKKKQMTYVDDLSDANHISNISDNEITRASVIDKLKRYLLNPEHPVGKEKARWFEQALGYTQNNMNALAKQIIFDENKAQITSTTEHGVKYNQVITINGANGRIIDVTFAWIRKNDGAVCLVTGIPSKK